jgi:hypothetical protein
MREWLNGPTDGDLCCTRVSALSSLTGWLDDVQTSSLAYCNQSSESSKAVHDYSALRTAFLILQHVCTRTLLWCRWLIYCDVPETLTKFQTGVLWYQSCCSKFSPPVASTHSIYLKHKWRWLYKFRLHTRMEGFIFRVSLRAFKSVRWTEAGSMCRNTSPYSTPRPAMKGQYAESVPFLLPSESRRWSGERHAAIKKSLRVAGENSGGWGWCFINNFLTK